ncbi:unnamed protein product, partial [Brenthis ino]
MCSDDAIGCRRVTSLRGRLPAVRQSLLERGTDRVDPLRCERLNLDLSTTAASVQSSSLELYLGICSVATLMEFRLDSAEYCQAQHK